MSRLVDAILNPEYFDNPPPPPELDLTRGGIPGYCPPEALKRYEESLQPRKEQDDTE